MSNKNSFKNKAIRREEREARKGAFERPQLSFEVPNTKPVKDEETGEEAVEVVGGPRHWYTLPGRVDRRGNRTRGRRGKTV